MFDFLSRQVMNLAAVARQPGYEGVLGEARRAAERDAPKTLVARPAMVEDQVVLAGGSTPARPALPIKPTDPVETGNRIRELLRRWRGQPRKSGAGSSSAAATSSSEEEAQEPTAQHFDRWA